MFSSILSNALDNAVNAQLKLPGDERQIKLLLKKSDGRLLLSIKNPFAGRICLDPASRFPMATKEGHSYGTQSILYLTERLGGKCQFSIQNNIFILRVVLTEYNISRLRGYGDLSPTVKNEKSTAITCRII